MTTETLPRHRPPYTAPSRAARIAAYASALSATVGFIPLHLTWAFGIPLFADQQLFRPWHDSGGGAYLYVLSALAVLPAVLALALVKPWGLVVPGWVPGLGGRPVPRLLPVACGYGLATLLLLYTGYAAVLGVFQADAPNKIFSPWLIVYGVPQFLIWAIGLWMATRSYTHRTTAGGQEPKRAAAVATALPWPAAPASALPWLAALWSAGYAGLAIGWARTGHGYPFGVGDPHGGASVLAGTHPMPASAVLAALAGIGLVTGVLLALPGTPSGVRRVLIWPAGLLAITFAVVIPDIRLLARLGYAPILLIGAPFGWPPHGVQSLANWPDLNQLVCALGGLLWAGTALVGARRLADRCLICGRGDDPAGWTSPAAALRWGRWAVAVAAVVPLLYAADRIGWALGIPIGMDQATMDQLRADGATPAALGLGLGGIGGAVLTLGLVQRWGEVFPRWIPFLRGRRVPIRLAVVPATVVSVAVLESGVAMYGVMLRGGLPPGGVAAIVPMLPWPLWGLALGTATLAYHYRRRSACRQCGRG